MQSKFIPKVLELVVENGKCKNRILNLHILKWIQTILEPELQPKVK